MTRKTLKDDLLDAAFGIAEKDGLDHLTLAAVAARAGVSKGGLFHHFRSKDDLLLAMSARVANTFNEELATTRGQADDTPGNLVKAYLRHGFSGKSVGLRGNLVVLAMLASRPELLAPVNQSVRARRSRVTKENANPAVALAAMLMADGLWLSDSLGISSITAKQRKEVLSIVWQWVNGAGGGTDRSTAANSSASSAT